jgi:uncharacterized protein
MELLLDRKVFHMTETKLPLATTNNHEIFASSSYLEVVDSIHASFLNNNSLIILIGEPGTGKTLLTRKLIKDQENDNFTVFFQDPRFTIDEILASAYKQIGVAAADQQNDLDIDKKLKVFYQYLQQRNREKGPVRFFLDNAQDFSPEALSKFLHLLEIHSDDNKRPLQVILIGLPLLEPLLTSLKLAELKIENPIYLHLKPLDTEEVGAFVTQRLKALGIDQNNFFPSSAITKIALYSQGVPSLLNILFDSIMAILNTSEHAGDITDIVDEAVETFSLPAGADNTNVHTIQTHKDQKKLNRKESIQASSSNELNKTLISGIREKVTDLFSQNKTGNKSATHDLRIKASKTEEDEDIFKVLAAELLNDIDDQDVKLDMHGEDFEALMEAKEENHLDANHESEPIIRPSIQQKNQVAIMNMNMHEQTMNRGERITQELKALQSGSPDVEAVALISEDGLIVASALPQDLDELRVGGMSATLLSLGTRSSAELRRGKVEEIIVRGDNGYTVMQNAGRGMLLLVVTNKNAKLGLIFFDMHEAIEKIGYIL